MASSKMRLAREWSFLSSDSGTHEWAPPCLLSSMPASSTSDDTRRMPVAFIAPNRTVIVEPVQAMITATHTQAALNEPAGLPP